MAKVTVKIRRRIKIIAKIRTGTGSGGACPVITDIEGGGPGQTYGPINGNLDGGGPGL